MKRPLKKSSPAGRLTRFVADTRGATIVEYALMLFLILVVAAAAVTQLGKTSRSGIDHATGSFTP
jgi:Flp pilus assembly pilin Flp